MANYQNRREKTRYVPNWPAPTEESFALFNSHVELGDALANKYIRLYYFPGHDFDDVKQEVLMGVWKASLYFKPEKGVKFGTYASQTVHNRLVNIMRNETIRIHCQNEGSDLLLDIDEDHTGIHLLGTPKYLQPNDKSKTFDDEKNIMEEGINNLEEPEFDTLSKLRRGERKRGTDRQSIIRSYHKIGKKLKKTFIESGMEKDFNNIVDYMLA